jgi:ATP-dependent DNA ligase
VPLPLKPPLKPQLARSATQLPAGEDWRYEPKWDGFRTVVFRDGDDVHLQSRNGRPMNRYFPEVPPEVLALAGDRLVLDGELIVVVDGVQEFDLLGQRIHPAESRVRMLAEMTPAAFVAFDLLAEGDEALLELPYEERRARLEAAVDGERVQLTPMTADGEAAGAWLTGRSEGVVAKQADAPYRPGERTGMLKIKRVRTADVVVQAFRFGKEPNTVGSLILGLYNDDDELQVVGHTSGFTARQKRELVDLLEPYRTHERGTGEPSRWKSDEELVWEGLRPELVCEVAFDQLDADRFRHAARLRRWRPDRDPRSCRFDQLPRPGPGPMSPDLFRTSR